MFKGFPCQKEMQLATCIFTYECEDISFGEISFVNLNCSLMNMAFKD